MVMSVGWPLMVVVVGGDAILFQLATEEVGWQNTA